LIDVGCLDGAAVATTTIENTAMHIEETR
jgi:hypothetical protein